MRTAICLPVLVLCSACSVVPPQAWTFDPRDPPPKITLPIAHVTAMTDRLAELQLERNRIRARIAAERDARVRQQEYRQLHEVGMELSPLERQLAAAVSGR